MSEIKRYPDPRRLAGQKRKKSTTRRIYDDLDESRDQCGAYLPKRGEGYRCKNPPVPGHYRCRFHGGKSLSGIAHPKYKGKGYTISLPAKYAELLAHLTEHPDLLGSVAQELALHTARHHELMGRLTTGEFGGSWRRQKRRLAKLRAAVEAQDFDRINEHLDALTALTDDAIADDATWSEITKNSRTIMQLADTERKRDEMLAKTITEKQWVRMVTRVGMTVRDRSWQDLEGKLSKEEIRRFLQNVGEDLRIWLYATKAADPEAAAKLRLLQSGHPDTDEPLPGDDDA